MSIEKNKKNLYSNFFSLSILQVFSYILPLITLPYLVKTLGTENFGLVIFAQSFIVFLNIFVDFGFNLSATREISIYRDNKDKITEIFSSVIIIKAFLMFLSFVILTVTILSVKSFSNNWELYYFSFLLVIGNAMFPVWYFQGIEKMKYITIVNILSKLIFTLLIFVIVRDSNDFLYVPILYGIGSIIGGGVSLYIIRYSFHQSFNFQKWNVLQKYFMESSQFFLSRLSSVGYSNINTFLVGILLTPNLVTYYYLADKIVHVSLSIFNPIVQTIYPYLSKKFEFEFFIKLLLLVISGSFVILLLLFFLSDFISFILLKEYNQTFIQIVHILIVLIPISIIYVFIGAPLLLARGFKKEFNLSIIYGFVLHLIVLTFLYTYYLNYSNHDTIVYWFATSLVVSKFSVLLLRSYYVYIHKLYKR